MPRFVFQAKTLQGKLVQGEVEAANDAEVRIKLRAQQLVPLKIGLKSKGSSGGAPGLLASLGPRVGTKELQVFTRQFATLINSGVPVVQSLEMLTRGTKSPLFRRILTGITQKVSEGSRLAEAMRYYPMAFDRLFINLVRAGEEAGVLDKVLNRLAVYIEKAAKIRSQIFGAMVYPVGVLFVAGIIIAAILVFVIPKFKEIFENSGQELPQLTQLVIDMSEKFIAKWPLIIGGIVLGIFAIIQFYKSRTGREICDSLLIRLPVFGTLVQKSAVAKFARTMETLISSGIGILEALEISSQTVGNFVIEQAILRARVAVEKGKSMVSPLASERFMPDMVTQMIGVGEQTGGIDTMLSKVADFYEEEVDNAVSALTSIMEPILMIFLGGIVAVLVIAMYLPVFNMANTV